MIQNFWTAGDIGMIVSDGGVGKTTLALHIAAAVAGGYPLLEKEEYATRRGGVLYVSEEDPAEVLLGHLDALIAGHGWDSRRVKENFHLYPCQGVSLDSEAWQRKLLEVARTLQVQLVVFDPLAELTQVDENSNTEMKGTIRFARQLAKESGAAVVILHHANKEGANARRKLDRIRGASALNAAARVIYFLKAQGDGFVVECVKLSRAKRPEPFVVVREITPDPRNDAAWLAARLSCPRTGTCDEEARQVVLKIIGEHSGVTSTELRKRAVGTGPTRPEITDAQKHLEAEGKIYFQEGKQNAKHWYLATLPKEPGAIGQTQPARQTEACPGQLLERDQEAAFSKS